MRIEPTLFDHLRVVQAGARRAWQLLRLSRGLLLLVSLPAVARPRNRYARLLTSAVARVRGWIFGGVHVVAVGVAQVLRKIRIFWKSHSLE